MHDLLRGDQSAFHEKLASLSSSQDIGALKARVRELGTAAFKNRDYGSAIEQFSAALALETDEAAKAVLLSNRAQCHLSLGKVDDATRNALQAIALDEANFKAWYRLAVALRQTKKLLAAQTAAQKCLTEIEKASATGHFVKEAQNLRSEIQKDIDELKRRRRYQTNYKRFENLARKLEIEDMEAKLKEEKETPAVEYSPDLTPEQRQALQYQLEGRTDVAVDGQGPSKTSKLPLMDMRIESFEKLASTRVCKSETPAHDRQRIALLKRFLALQSAFENISSILDVYSINVGNALDDVTNTSYTEGFEACNVLTFLSSNFCSRNFLESLRKANSKFVDVAPFPLQLLLIEQLSTADESESDRSPESIAPKLQPLPHFLAKSAIQASKTVSKEKSSDDAAVDVEAAEPSGDALEGKALDFDDIKAAEQESTEEFEWARKGHAVLQGVQQDEELLVESAENVTAAAEAPREDASGARNNSISRPITIELHDSLFAEDFVFGPKSIFAVFDRMRAFGQSLSFTNLPKLRIRFGRICISPLSTESASDDDAGSFETHGSAIMNGKAGYLKDCAFQSFTVQPWTDSVAQVTSIIEPEQHLIDLQEWYAQLCDTQNGIIATEGEGKAPSHAAFTTIEREFETKESLDADVAIFDYISKSDDEREIGQRFFCYLLKEEGMERSDAPRVRSNPHDGGQNVANHTKDEGKCKFRMYLTAAYCFRAMHLLRLEESEGDLVRPKAGSESTTLQTHDATERQVYGGTVVARSDAKMSACFYTKDLLLPPTKPIVPSLASSTICANQEVVRAENKVFANILKAMKTALIAEKRRAAKERQRYDFASATSSDLNGREDNESLTRAEKTVSVYSLQTDDIATVSATTNVLFEDQFRSSNNLGQIIGKTPVDFDFHLVCCHPLQGVLTTHRRWMRNGFRFSFQTGPRAARRPVASKWLNVATGAPVPSTSTSSLSSVSTTSTVTTTSPESKCMIEDENSKMSSLVCDYLLAHEKGQKARLEFVEAALPMLRCSAESETALTLAAFAELCQVPMDTPGVSDRTHSHELSQSADALILEDLRSLPADGLSSGLVRSALYARRALLSPPGLILPGRVRIHFSLVAASPETNTRAWRMFEEVSRLATGPSSAALPLSGVYTHSAPMPVTFDALSAAHNLRLVSQPELLYDLDFNGDDCWLRRAAQQEVSFKLKTLLGEKVNCEDIVGVLYWCDWLFVDEVSTPWISMAPSAIHRSSAGKIGSTPLPDPLAQRKGRQALTLLPPLKRAKSPTESESRLNSMSVVFVPSPGLTGVTASYQGVKPNDICEIRGFTDKNDSQLMVQGLSQIHNLVKSLRANYEQMLTQLSQQIHTSPDFALELRELFASLTHDNDSVNLYDSKSLNSFAHLLT